MLVQVKIKGQVITSQFGTLSTGDILRCDKAFADHLVNDCDAAEYVEQAESEVDPVEDAEKSKVAKSKKEG